MILDTTTRKLQLQLTTAVTTAAMPIIIDYVDNTTTTFTPSTSLSVSNGVTLVDILAAPAASTQRKVNSLTIYNLDTAAKTVRIYLNDNGTSYQILDVTLQIDDVLGYTDTGGWYTIDLNGNQKVVQSSVFSSGVTIGGLIDISGASAGQIKFPATQNSSANVNTLDDYLESSWTPSLVSWGGTGLAASGTYVKIGRLVFFTISVTGTALTTIAGVSTASLPSTPVITAVVSYVNSVGTQGGTGVSAGGVVVPTIAFTSSTNILIEGSYFVAT